MADPTTATQAPGTSDQVQTSTVTAANTPSFMDNLMDTFNQSVSNVKDMAGFVTSKAQAAAGAIAGNAGAGQAGFGQQQAGVTALTGAETDVSNIQAAAAIKQKNDDAAMAQSGGTDPAAAAAYASQMKATQAQLLATDQQITDAKSVSVFDDPLQWVVNKFTTPGLETKREALAQQFGDQNTSMADIKKLTSDQFALNSSLDVAASTQLQQAQAAQIAAKGQIMQGQTAVDAAKFSNESITAALAPTMQAFQAQEETVRANSDALNQAREQDKQGYYDLLKKEQIDKMSDNLDERKAQETRLTAVSTAAGLGPMDIHTFGNLAPSQKKALSNASASLLTTGSFGFDPAEAYKNVTDIGAPPVSGGAGLTQNWLGGIVSAREAAYGPGFKGAPVTVQNGIINAEVTKQAGTELQNIDPVRGLYAPPPLSTMIKLPAFTDNDIGQRMTALAAGTDGKGLDATYPTKMSDISSNALQLIAEGKLTPAQAAGQTVALTGLIQQATNGLKQYSKYALPQLGSQTAAGGSYKQTVPSPGMLPGSTSSTTIDWHNQSQVESYYRRMGASAIYNKAGLREQSSGANMFRPIGGN